MLKLTVLQINVAIEKQSVSGEIDYHQTVQVIGS